MALRRTQLPMALHRPNLIAGGERNLVLMCGLVSIGLIVTALNWPATIFGILFWLVCIAILRRMAKADPMLSGIYLRSLQYQSYYPSHSRPKVME